MLPGLSLIILEFILGLVSDFKHPEKNSKIIFSIKLFQKIKIE
jgi:hypothetical protein